MENSNKFGTRSIEPIPRDNDFLTTTNTNMLTTACLYRHGALMTNLIEQVATQAHSMCASRQYQQEQEGG